MQTETKLEESSRQRRLDLLLRTGQLLMESGADTSRIRRNMMRTAAFLGLPEQGLHVFINYNMLMVCLSDGEHSTTRFQRCEGHGINMDAISAVSHLSWTALRENYSLDDYAERLAEIRHQQRNYSPWQVAVGAGLACGGFCVQFGCDWLAFFYASLAAIVGFRLRWWLGKKGSNAYVNIAVAAFASTLIAWLFAIQVCGIDNFVHDLSMTPHHEYNEYMLAAAISAMGFSMIFNTPRHLLWIVALGGIVAVCTRNLVSLGPSSGNIGLDMGPVVGSFVGSALVSVLSTRLIHLLHVPHHCIAIPSVIPMIPGVLMYRALFAFIDMHGIIGEVTVAMNNAIRASLIILFIAMGVAIPNIFFRRMIEPRRKQKLLSLLSRRRETVGF